MTTRRKFLAMSAMAAASAGRCMAAAISAGTPAIRNVDQGELRGEVTGGVLIFRGVPYAEAPLGGLRFRAPRPPRHWTGVREATLFADAAMQARKPGVSESEDCLYLNIWAPEGVGPYPVFVWIHGGGFTAGRTSEAIYDGTRFAQAGIVCITVAYRLGVFGFLDVSKYFGPVYTASADNALLDLIAALRWVQSNIAAFGGDPNRVTIGGESAGAKLTDTLMGVPEAQPLFHQMISESGGADRIWTEDGAANIAVAFAAEWTHRTGLTTNDLLNADAGKIIGVQEEFTKVWPKHFPLRPELNDRLIPAAPLTTIRNGSTRGKRLLLGTNRDESALFLGPHPQSITAADLGNLTLQQFQPLEDSYQALYAGEPEDLRRIRALTAEEYWIPSLRVADAHVHAGGEAYVYRLDLPARGRFAGLAFHSYDLRFVWDFFDLEHPSEVEQKLAAGVHNAWIAFIQGQPPAGPGLPTWPPYSLEKRPTMLLDQVSRIEYDPGAAEFRIWDGLLEN